MYTTSDKKYKIERTLENKTLCGMELQYARIRQLINFYFIADY